ncbi:unnamed protein product [Triticum turgidum subsp. durum]|uniref:3-oxo-5-alpha-steroid 4-dehydrogenase C-terminal domain-containing protein n=1 Tax=Triticum turgidum subsp. durum TaxID=4567 RepID=A0A9R1PV08_TRITD|nr:unnamed protein product [Triticum turgidum subsp. durum]
MPDLVIDSPSLLKPLLKLGWCQWIGAIIFLWGSLHQIRCHAILGSLRENKDSDEYVIPCDDWFSRVSCPHYLAELVSASILLPYSACTCFFTNMAGD